MPLDGLEKRLANFKKKSGKKSGRAGDIEDKPEPILQRIAEFEDELADDHKWLKKVLLIGSVVSAVIIGLGLLFIFLYTSSSRDVNLEISSADSVLRGAPFDVELSVTNNSGSPIRNAMITINLPEGLMSPDSTRDKSLVSESIGDVTSGNLIKKTYSLVPTAALGSKETVTAVLSYAIETGARFEVREAREVEVNNPAIEIDVKKPDQILSGSTFSVDVTYKNKSDFNFPNLTLEADYPDAFRFDSASIPPASLNNYWQLGGLIKGGEGKLSILGHLNLSAGANVALPIRISANFGGQDYEIAEGSLGLSPASSPLSLEVLVNNQSSYLGHLDDTLNYSVSYQNSSGIALADAKIKAVLTGSMADLSSIDTDGSFNSANQTITWDSSNTPALKLLSPGASGEVNFKFKIKSSFDLQKLNDRNFSIRADVVMSSPSVPYYLSASQTMVESVYTIKIAGQIYISVLGFFGDDSTGIENKGSLPPQVGQPTQYMIHWLIKNFASEVVGVEVRSALAPGVKIVGQPSANLGTISYNESDNLIVWSMDRVASAKGVLNDPAEAVFQIEATPDASMIGLPEPLIQPTSLKGTDNFTGLALEGEFPAFSTAMLNDTAGSSNSLVRQ